MAELFDEIKEDIKHERYVKILQSYGYHLIGGIIAFIVIASVVMWMRESALKEREAAGTSFITASKALTREDFALAGKLFSSIGEDGPDGYSQLAALRRAGVFVKEGKTAEALAAYDGLAEDNNVDIAVKDMAALLAAHLVMESGNAAEAKKRLEPLTGKKHPWRHSALDLSATIALDNGDREKARTIYEDLRDDIFTPPSLRQKAQTIIAIISAG